MLRKQDREQLPEPGALTKYSNLFRILDEVEGHAPANLLEAIKQLPEHTTLPPWVLIWRLIKYVAGEPRRAWARTTLLPLILKEREVKTALRQWHTTPIPCGIQGRVRNQPDWRFVIDIHDIDTDVSVSLRHRERGEMIGLDFRVGADGHRKRFGSLTWQLKKFGSWGGRTAVEAKAVVHLLAEHLPTHHTALQSFYERWQDEGQKLWLSALLGDWLCAHAAALIHGDDLLIAETARRAANLVSQNDVMKTEGFQYVGSDWDTRWAVRVLARHQVPYLDDILKYGFEEHADFFRPALALILEEDLPGWEEEILCWFLATPRVRTASEALAAAYLARRDIRIPQVIRALVNLTCDDADQWDLLAAFVAARYDSRLGERLFRKGLSSSNSDSTRIEAIAGLVVSDSLWADGLLRESVDDLQSPLTEGACRLALRHRKNSLTPAQSLNAGQSERAMLVIGRGPRMYPLNYLGTVEDYFEEAVELALRCKRIANQNLKVPPITSEVRRGQEQRFREGGIDEHGIPRVRSLP